MKTVIKKISGDTQADAIVFAQASEVIKKGGILVFPTETLYGIGADALNEKACENIYKAKGRPEGKPLIVLISKKEQLTGLVDFVPDAAAQLTDKFWPGALTLIFKKSKKIPDAVSGGGDTVAVRLTSNEVIRRIIEEANTPIVAPSANPSGEAPALTAKEAYKYFDGVADMIIEADDTISGSPSTIADVTGGNVRIVRRGAVKIK